MFSIFPSLESGDVYLCQTGRCNFKETMKNQGVGVERVGGRGLKEGNWTQIKTEHCSR